jgi:hypothetical protein
VGCVVPGTSFTTVTANRDPTGVHRDSGNLPGALGALTVIRAGPYTGGLFVYPEYRLAFDLRTGDVLIADQSEAHGNTVIVGVEGEYERVSVVCYVHASNVPPGDLRWPL